MSQCKSKCSENIPQRVLRLLCEKFASELPNCREKSLCMTKLEEAEMWLNKIPAAALPVKCCENNSEGGA